MPSPNQNAWIEQVLGVVLDEAPTMVIGSAAIEAAWRDAFAEWRVQSEAVDQEISSLQSYLRGTDDEDFHYIAEFGLNGMMDGRKVALIKALHGLERATAVALRDAAPAALTAVAAFSDHIEHDPRVTACDRNHFGVSVSIRSHLLPALSLMERTLRTSQEM